MYDVVGGVLVVVCLWWLMWLIGECVVVVFDGGIGVWVVVGLLLEMVVFECVFIMVMIYYDFV